VADRPIFPERKNLFQKDSIYCQEKQAHNFACIALQCPHRQNILFKYPPCDHGPALALAKVNTSISAALFFIRMKAHSLTVAPVVKTSSTSRILLFVIFAGYLRLKAFLTFLLLSMPLKPVWDSVCFCLASI
jgi:hypothetical protein